MLTKSVVYYIYELTISVPMNNQKTTNQVVETRDRKFSQGIVVAMSCEILKINDETYRVQSEKTVDRYYVVRFSGGEPNYCTCKNWEIQSQRNADHVCKHMHSIIYASVNGLIIEQVPSRIMAKSSVTSDVSRLSTYLQKQVPTKSWKGDQYDF